MVDEPARNTFWQTSVVVQVLGDSAGNAELYRGDTFVPIVVAEPIFGGVVLFDNYCDNFSEGSGRGVPNDTRLQGDEAGRESELGGTSGGFRESA